jgi:hypothetical protein
VSVLAVSVALAPAAEAKKKKGKTAVTRSASTPFTQSSNATTTATCPKGMHASGGGFAVSPNFTPPNTGLRSLNSTSHQSGVRTWNGGGSAYASPTASGSFTTYARCESNSRGHVTVRASSDASLQPAFAQSLIFNCPPGTHVLTGGVSGSSLASFAFNVASARIVVVASRRTGQGQWTVTAFNNEDSPAAATVTGYATCERNAKGRSISTASATVPVADNARTSADATCSKKKYAIGGGFVVTPLPPGNIPFVGIDESAPVGKRGWHVGLHEFVPFTLPAGSALQTIAYCKKS